METNIDPQLSLYSLINRGTISPQNIFAERRNVLARWCRTIEMRINEERLNTNVYANFQQLEYFGPVFPRYQKMAQVTKNIFIFGEPNATYEPVDNIHYVALSQNDQLVREWFLLVNHERYAEAVVAQEVTPPGTPHKDRMFKGIMTTNRDIIEILGDWLENSVIRTLPTLSSHLS